MLPVRCPCSYSEAAVGRSRRDPCGLGSALQGVAQNTETPNSICTYGTGRSREKKENSRVRQFGHKIFFVNFIRLTRIGDSLTLFGGAIGFNDS